MSDSLFGRDWTIWRKHIFALKSPSSFIPLQRSTSMSLSNWFSFGLFMQLLLLHIYTLVHIFAWINGVQSKGKLHNIRVTLFGCTLSFISQTQTYRYIVNTLFTIANNVQIKNSIAWIMACRIKRLLKLFHHFFCFYSLSLGVYTCNVLSCCLISKRSNSKRI